MTREEVKKALLVEYYRALKSVDSNNDDYFEYRAGINYFMGWLSSAFEITEEEMAEAREELYK